MNYRTILAASTLVAMIASAPSGAEVSPYADDTTRSIKALSAEETRAYLEGDGMGFARAAELNGYPGPRHVLDLSDALSLTDEQRARSATLHREMKARASALGAELVGRERELDALFASGAIDDNALARLVGEIGALQGELRLVHLAAHLGQRAILSERQVMLYNRLRGYGGTGGGHGHAH